MYQNVYFDTKFINNFLFEVYYIVSHNRVAISHKYFRGSSNTYVKYLFSQNQKQFIEIIYEIDDLCDSKIDVYDFCRERCETYRDFLIKKPFYGVYLKLMIIS